MADNPTIASQSSSQTATLAVAADDVSSVFYQYVKLDVGGDGLSVPVTAAAPLPVVESNTANLRASSASNTGSQVSVTASPAVTVLGSNAARKGYRIYYPSAVWASYGGTASSSTFLLPAGSVDEMTDGLIYTGAISAISVSGTITAYVVEW